LPATPGPAATQTFMVVGIIRDDANLAELAALRDDEHKQLEALRSEGKIGAHYVSQPRKATFIEVIAADEKQVAETLATLPFARLFDVDVYPTAPPDEAEAAHRARLSREPFTGDDDVPPGSRTGPTAGPAGPAVNRDWGARAGAPVRGRRCPPGE
jgi:hypothetical protein